MTTPTRNALRAVRVVAALTFAAAASACSEWLVQSGPSAVAVKTAVERRDNIRVERMNGEVVVLRSPSVSGDSVRGRAYYAGVREWHPAAAALSDIRNVEYGSSRGPQRRFLTWYLLSAWAVGYALLWVM